MARSARKAADESGVPASGDLAVAVGEVDMAHVPRGRRETGGDVGFLDVHVEEVGHQL